MQFICVCLPHMAMQLARVCLPHMAMQLARVCLQHMAMHLARMCLQHMTESSIMLPYKYIVAVGVPERSLCRLAGPGFINIKLERSWLAEHVQGILKDGVQVCTLLRQ